MSETYTFKAAGDLSGAYRHLVRITDGLETVNIGSLATHSSLIGLLVNKPNAAGRHASVMNTGFERVVAGAAISSVGVYFTTNGSGRAVAATSGQMVAGRILEAAAADGNVVRCQLVVPFRLSGAV